MKYQISPDRSKLTITADDKERAQLEAMEPRELQSDQQMQFYFENMLCNSELAWIRPEETGDLTDAPMLGFYGDFCSNEADKVKSRWAFMDYQVRSVLEDLRDKSEVIFVGGPL